MLPVSILFAPSDARAANFGGITDNGTAAYMGIGANPHAIRPLYVFGNAALFQRNQDSAGFIIQRTDENRWVLGVNESTDLGRGFVLSTYPASASSSTPRLLVTQDGRVCIGTVTPGPISRLIAINDNSTSGASAIYGQSLAAPTYGVYGVSSSGTGVRGDTDNGTGVFGLGQSGYGVVGNSNSNYGVYGVCAGGPYGYLGGPSVGAGGSSSSGYGVIGQSVSGIGVRGSSTSGYAGWFQGKVKVAGSFATAFTTVYDNYTATDSDSVIAVNNDVNDKNIIITLPSTSGKEGRTYTIKKVDDTAFGVDVDGSGSDTIEGSPTAVRMYNQWDYITVVCDGVNWLIIGKNF